MTTAVHPYIEALLSGTREVPAAREAWLNERRGAALERANALSVPTTRDEEWRFTDLAPLTRLTWRVPGAKPSIAAEAIERYIVPEAGARLVFVDGVFAPALSALDPCPGMTVAPLAQAMERGVALESHLARLATFERDVFVALNTAHLKDAAVVHIARDAVCDKAVHILHLASEGGTAAFPRCIVVAEQGAACTIVEEYQSLTADAYFGNAVTEISVAASAKLHHVKLQLESSKAFHIATAAVRLARDASYTSQTISVGARLSRYDLDVRFDGEGAVAQVDGLALIAERQLADTHTTLDHAQANCRSVQLHKTIVGGAAHAVFNGKICVRQGAQLTDSAQQSRNLLLSDRATIDAKPQLEIFADDVKCAHGATVGQLDLDQLFYLRSRGIPDQAARNLLTYAFGASVIERIPVPSVVKRLEALVMAQTGAQA